MPFSYHSHSAQFCKHASGGSLSDVVEAARSAGYSHFGLSEHMPRLRHDLLYPEEIEAGMSCQDLVAQFDEFVLEARRLQAQEEAKQTEGSADCLQLLVGAETEYTGKDSIREILELRGKHNLDYIVGSLHHVRGKPIDFSKQSFEQLLAGEWQGDHEALFCEYFDEQLSLLEGVQPEVVGHFDVVLKYCPAVKMSGKVLEKVRRNVRYCVEHDILVEINSSGVGKGLRRPYPQPDVVVLAKELGARFTVSDDAHSPSDVALYYGHVRQYIHDMTIASSVYCLRRRQQQRQDEGVVSKPSAGYIHSFRFVQAELVPDFLSHEFWSRSASYELAQ